MTAIDAPRRVYRVTVRGAFHQLSDEARRFLTSSAAEHDVFKSSFTEEGTFTYDERLAFFNFRYEVRRAGPDAEADAIADSIASTEAFLRTMRIGFKGLRGAAMDMSAMMER